MPKHDDDDIIGAPSMVPDRDELDSYQRSNPSKSAPKLDDANAADTSEPRSNVLTYFIGAIALLGVAAAGYLFVQLQNAEQRVVALEQRLSSTDESVNQSSGALQVKINDVNEALTQVRDETLKKYKAQIDQQASQIAALEKSAKSSQAAIGEADKTIAEHAKSLDGLRADVAKYSAVADQAKQKADQHQPLLDTLSSKTKSLSDAQAKLDARLNANEEWVESINTFRKQMNREIVNIKQQLAGGKPTPPPQEIQ